MRLQRNVVTVGVLLAIALVFFVFPSLFYMQRASCRIYSYDVANVRYKVDRYLLGVQISSQTYDTELRASVDKLGKNEESADDWRIDTVLPGLSSTSMQYAFHGSIALSKRLSQILAAGEFADPERAEIIQRFREKLQAGANNSEAHEYVNEILMMLEQK